MRHPIAARRAFTMVEMLVVISIIVLLVGLGILAYAHIDRATTVKATRANLQMAQGFLDEYAGGPGLGQFGMGNNQIDVHFPYKGGNFPAVSAPPSGPNNNGPIGGAADDKQTGVLTGSISQGGDQRFPIPNTPPTYSAGVMTAPMTVAWDFNYDPTSNPSTHNAIYNTGQVMVILMRLPAVAQRVAKVPSTKLLTLPAPGGANQLAFSVGDGNLAGPVLLDGWDNPIIFVPAGGLVTKVSGTPDGSPVLVRSSGTIVLDGKPYTAKNPPPLKDSDRPFWASAGPDGDFYGSSLTKTNGGDDNIYSFQQ